MWGAILGLIAALLPYILAWLQKLLKKTAATLPEPETFGTPQEAVGALFDAALKTLPKRAYLRRLVVRTLARVAMPRAAAIVAKARGEAVEVPPLSPEEAAELADATAAAK